MGVASCRGAFLCLKLRVRPVPFRISVHDLIPFSGRACRGLRSAKWLGPAQPGLARPGPARPWRPHLSHAPLLSLSLIWISHATTSPLPLPPLSPRGALGIGDGDHRNLDPEVSSPPLPFSSLSLSLLFFLPRARPPFPLLARAPTLPARPRWRAAAPPPPSPRRRAAAPPSPARGGARPPPPARPARPPAARPRLGPGSASGPRCGPRWLGPLRAPFWPLAWFAWPWRGLALPRLPLARSRVRKPTLAVIIFGW
jgi:hypothetical protein